jgi:hypothetical protein
MGHYKKCRALAKTRSLAHRDEASGGSERQKSGSGRGERDVQEACLAMRVGCRADRQSRKEGSWLSNSPYYSGASRAARFLFC